MAATVLPVLWRGLIFEFVLVPMRRDWEWHEAVSRKVMFTV